MVADNKHTYKYTGLCIHIYIYIYILKHTANSDSSVIMYVLVVRNTYEQERKIAVLDHEVGGSRFFRNVGERLQDYMALHTRR
jgi:hypothetical protein